MALGLPISVPINMGYMMCDYSTDGLNMGSFVPYVITDRAWNNLSSEQQESVVRSATATNRFVKA